MVFERDEDWRTVITVPWLKKKKGRGLNVRTTEVLLC